MGSRRQPCGQSDRILYVACVLEQRREDQLGDVVAAIFGKIVMTSDAVDKAGVHLNDPRPGGLIALVTTSEQRAQIVGVVGRA